MTSFIPSRIIPLEGMWRSAGSPRTTEAVAAAGLSRDRTVLGRR